MKNKDEISIEQAEHRLQEFLRTNSVSVPPIPRLQTPDCPSLGRFAVIMSEPNEVTERERGHIDSGCPYCKKAIDKFEKRLHDESGIIVSKDVTQKVFQNPATDNVVAIGSPSIGRRFTTQKSREGQNLLRGFLLAACTILGLLGYRILTEAPRPAHPVRRATNTPTPSATVEASTFTDNANVSVVLQNGVLTAKNLPPNLSPLINKALAGIEPTKPLPALGQGVGPTAGGNASSEPRAPQNLQPAGNVVVGLPVFSWSKAANFAVKKYRVEFRRLDVSSEAMPKYKAAGNVPASITKIVAKQPLPSGEYTWRVRVIGTPQPDIPDEIFSKNANFIVVSPEFQGSDVVMGVAYAQAGQWTKAEYRFQHLMQAQIGDSSGAVAVRRTAGSVLLKWLQSQRQSVEKAASSQGN